MKTFASLFLLAAALPARAAVVDAVRAVPALPSALSAAAAPLASLSAPSLAAAPALSAPLAAASLPARPVVPVSLPSAPMPAPLTGPARLPGVQRPIPVPQTLEVSDAAYLDWGFLDGPAAAAVRAPAPRGPKGLPPSGASVQLGFAAAAAKKAATGIDVGGVFDAKSPRGLLVPVE